MSLINDLIKTLSALFNSQSSTNSNESNDHSTILVHESQHSRINQAGLELIKSFEGLRLKAYRDAVGILTIGFGHTGPDVTVGLTITQDRAEEILLQDLNRFEHGVLGLVTVSINDNQFSALVAFAFNVGLDALKRSTLLKKLNSGDYIGSSKEFLKWIKAGGKVLPGLQRRRRAESELFLS